MQLKKDGSVSLFYKEPPATPQQTAQLLARLAVNFPKMNQQYAGVSFWTVLGEQLVELGWSEKRIRYAVNYMLQNYKYQTFNTAEFLSIDKSIKIYNYNEFFNKFGTTRVSGYCILKERSSDGRILFAITQEAKQLGLEIQEEFN